MKKIFCILLSSFMLFGAAVLPSSAETGGSFRVSVVIDSADIAGFGENSGTLRRFIDLLEKNEEVSVTFYYDASDTPMTGDFAASLLCFKVNGYSYGICGNDMLSVSQLNEKIKYVSKTASRLVLCDAANADAFEAAGYSAVSEFDIVIDGENEDITSKPEGETQVKTVLSEKSLYSFERFLDNAKETGSAVRGTN